LVFSEHQKQQKQHQQQQKQHQHFYKMSVKNFALNLKEECFSGSFEMIVSSLACSEKNVVTSSLPLQSVLEPFK
jgi:hypothetical protein